MALSLFQKIFRQLSYTIKLLFMKNKVNNRYEQNEVMAYNQKTIGTYREIFILRTLGKVLKCML